MSLDGRSVSDGRVRVSFPFPLTVEADRRSRRTPGLTAHVYPRAAVETFVEQLREAGKNPVMVERSTEVGGPVDVLAVAWDADPIETAGPIFRAAILPGSVSVG